MILNKRIQENLAFNQKGQAISETLLTVLMLTPFVLLLPGIIHLLDIQNQAHESARFSAWQSTVYRSEDALLLNHNEQLARQVNHRVLDNMRFANTSPSSNPSQVAYRDYQDQQSLINSSDELSVRQSYQAVEAEYESQIDTFMLPIEGQSQGMLQVKHVSIPIRSNAALFNSNLTNRYANSTTLVDLPYDEVAGVSRLNIQSRGALVTDAWQPVSEQDFTAAVNGLTEPTQLSMAAWESVIRPASGFLRELRILYRNGDTSLNSVYGQQSRLLPTRLRRYSNE